ncbi:FHA domain-containing protein [Nannocystis exedens]|uniref:FHA domain-containing protein n=1 Tax=Nannocystis exedens TaxID=54 RepID=A0A1I1ZDE5_9BACT|nr:FHA domain-containing protein [Nannocystis exedens]PCC75024.1 FHA domain-containing protein [Nannocystis exedens]SFE29781.1 FHA domain-containing protein [Nannocystis exedens]
MGVLRGPEGDVELPERCLIGRSRGCDLVLAARDVSGEHAVLQWSATHWELRDLGSRNGSYVGEVRLTPGGRATLAAGATLQFGHESGTWQLIDAGAPRALAVALVDGTRRAAEGGYLALPHESEPRAAIYQTGDGRWWLEQDGATREVEDRTVIDADGLWRVCLPARAAGPREDGASLRTVAQLRLRFAVSDDEEEVELVACSGERRLDLQARAPHYPLLLLLARRRVADVAAGVPAGEQGWLRQGELLAMLGMKEDRLGVLIHGARAQLARAGVADAAALIERRPGTRLLRLGVAAIEVVPLA